MAIVPLPNVEPQGTANTDDWELRSLTARNMSPLNAVTTTLERAGGHWAVTPRFHNLNSSTRAVMQRFLADCRGHANRFYLPFYGWTRRGSFPATELLTNNTFASGTTGWSTTLSQSASDGLYRITRLAHYNTADLAYSNSAGAVTVMQYAPYAARSIDHLGRSANWSAGPQIGSALGGEEYGRANSSSFGLKTLVSVLPATTAYFGLVDYDGGANMAGDFIEFSYTSFARCALVDNGPNFFQRSDQIDNAYWTKTACSASTDGGGAPDGTTTADIVTEDSTNAQHVVFKLETRTSQTEDWCVFGHFERATGTRNIRLVIASDSGTNWCGAIFDLGSGTIAAGPTNAGTGTNARAFIKSMGGNRYYCAVVGRLAASTQVLAHFELCSGTTTGYLGDGSSSISMWRIGATQSSVPTRGMQTTSAGDSDGVAQTGSALHLKGLPASTNGLLLQGDPAEIIIGTTSQLVRTRSSLNSDAAGLGYWQFEPPLRVSPSDNAGVIIQNPLCKMMMENNVAKWSEHSGGFSDLEFAAVEDTYPS